MGGMNMGRGQGMGMSMADVRSYGHHVKHRVQKKFKEELRRQRLESLASDSDDHETKYFF